MGHNCLCFLIFGLFQYFGHEHVSVLNGGLRMWKTKGFPVTSDTVPVPQVKRFLKSLILIFKLPGSLITGRLLTVCFRNDIVTSYHIVLPN